LLISMLAINVYIPHGNAIYIVKKTAFFFVRRKNRRVFLDYCRFQVYIYIKL